MRRASLLVVIVLCLVGLPAPSPSARAEEGVLARLAEALGDPDRGVRFAAAGSLGLAGEKGGVEADALVAALDDPEWCVRRQAARSLRTIGRAAFSQATALLDHPDAEHRSAAVSVLAQIDPEGTPGLRRALHDRDERIRFDAARALLARSEGTPPGDVLETLRGLLTSKDLPLGIEAAGVLVELGHPEEATTVLVEGLSKPMMFTRTRMASLLTGAGRAVAPHAKTLVGLLAETHDYSLADEIVSALRPLGTDVVPLLAAARTDETHPGMYRLREFDDGLRKSLILPNELDAVPTDALVARLWSGDAETGAQTMAALARRGGRAHPLLLAALTDPKRRASVFRILETIGLEPDLTLAFRLEMLTTGDDEEAWEAAGAIARSPIMAARAGPRLLALLENAAASERAYRLLGRLGDPRSSSREALLPLLDSPVPHARAWAARGLAGREARVLARAADPDARVRAAALDALSRARRNDARVAVLALGAVTDEDAVVREVAVDILERGDVRVGAELASRLGGVDVIPVARAIEACGVRARGALPALLARLGDDDPDVRRAVLRAVAAVGDAVAIPAVAARLEDTSRDVRIEAAEALGRLGPTAVPSLRRALTDGNWRVRRAAIRSLGELGGDAAPAGPDLVALLGDETLAVNIAAADALPRIGREIAVLLPSAMALGHYGLLSHAERIFIALGENGADATDGLATLLTHRDVNIREVAARSLGEIGPGAAAAIPALIDALEDVRISVRGRAMTALGRIGDAATPALLDALTHADARVRGGAVYALGWIVRGEDVPPLVPIEVRLPMAEPGPAKDTGFEPTVEQRVRARTVVSIKGRSARRESLADLGANERIHVLRAGLRGADLPTAIACAATLDMENLVAWEAERVVELLLPECFRPGSGIEWGDFYEIASSGEMPALLDFMALSPISDTERETCLGAMHRVVLSNVLPTVYRMRQTPDARIVDDSSLEMPRNWSDRYRELDAADAPASDGLHPGLRKLLRGDKPWPSFTNGWLNDSIPAPRDIPLLLEALRSVLAKREGDLEFARFADHARDVVLRALGHGTDGESERVLWSLADDHVFALAALARRGDPDAIRRLAADAATSWDALSLLLEVRPDLGPEALRAQVLDASLVVSPEDDDWTPRMDRDAIAAVGLDDDFMEIQRKGARWTSRVFRGIEEAAVASITRPRHLIWLTRHVPGCRTRRMGRAILAGLTRVGAYDLDLELPNALFAFLVECDREALVALLRTWATSEEQYTRDTGLWGLAFLGDADPAGRQLEWWRQPSTQEEYMDVPAPPLHRSRSEPIRKHYRDIAADPDRPDPVRLDAARRLAASHGFPLAATEPFARDKDEEDARDRFITDMLAGPTEDRLRACIERLPEGAKLDALATLDPAAARRLGRAMLHRRSAVSCPYTLGLLSRLGDSDARAEVWSAFRVGRYRWITYQNDSDALTLGWRPESYPGWTEHLHGNCCRSGHVSRMFEELICRMDVFPTMPYGQDATPPRTFHAWIDLHGGRWTRSAFETIDVHTSFTAVPE